MKHLMIVAALGMVASSFAQNAPVVDTNGLSVRLGGEYPFEKGVRNVLGNPTALGLDIVAPQSYIKNTSSFISIDYFAKQFGKSKYFMPVMLNAKFGGMTLSGRDSYGFLGVGAVFANISTSATLFGARAGVGTHLGEHVFVEAAAMFSTDRDGMRANNFGVYLGYKF